MLQFIKPKALHLGSVIVSDPTCVSLALIFDIFTEVYILISVLVFFFILQTSLHVFQDGCYVIAGGPDASQLFL